MMKKDVDPARSRFLPLDSDRLTQLMHAARHAHLQNAKSLLYGVSPDISDHTGRTAFSWIASYDLTRTPTHDRDEAERFVQFLLDRDANPNLADHHGETPLHWAVKEGNYPMVELLLQKDVLPDLGDSRDRTPLSRAAERGYTGILKLLLSQAQAETDSKDLRGRTPLSWAAENWHLESVSTLLSHGASVDIHDHEGQIPLWWFLNNTAKRSAVAHDQLENSQGNFQTLFKLLGPRNGVEPLTKARRTFLSWACEKGDEQLVSLLLQTTWADPNSIDRYRKTPLIYALEWNHYDIADMLVSGSDSFKPSRKDVVSLRLMIQEEGRSRLLKPFLERYKPTLEEEDERSSTPLMRIALLSGDRATVAVLLEHRASLQGLDNSSWFGPCSTIGTITDLKILTSARGGYSSIPLMKMAIQEGDRAAVAALLDHRAKILDIHDDENDFRQYSNTRQSMAVHISSSLDGEKLARWILEENLDREIQELRRVPEEPHLMLFRENHAWKTYCQSGHLPNELGYSLGHKSPCRTFTLSIRMNLRMESTPQSEYDPFEGDTLRIIEWSVLEAPPKTVHYYSNLPYGWIPQNDLEFVQLFMQTWREDWLTFCRDARRHLSALRSHQLTARGRDDLLIDAVAENMLQWTHIQGILADQLSQIRGFVSNYQGFSETRKFSEQMNEIINLLDRDISTQIDKLEQTVRDLLQIEFAWVSINEAHRSTSVATSMKRLSWITFVFLPLTFASSLFGMNVDILQDNPTWRWYPLVGGTLLLLSFGAWICSKFTNMEKWIAGKTQAMHTPVLERKPTLRRMPTKDIV